MTERRQPPDSRRKLRSRPTPRWLLSDPKIDPTARLRCLLILSVLSGAIPVTEAVRKARISRQNYYLLEKRALLALLQSLIPGAGEPGATSQGAKISALEKKVSRLEQEKRRAERLLSLTSRLFPKRPPGRPAMKNSARRLKLAGRRHSRASKPASPPPEKSEMAIITGAALL